MIDKGERHHGTEQLRARGARIEPVEAGVAAFCGAPDAGYLWLALAVRGGSGAARSAYRRRWPAPGFTGAAADHLGSVAAGVQERAGTRGALAGERTARDAQRVGAPASFQHRRRLPRAR